MSTLEEIEAAASALPPAQKQELLLFLAARLREEGTPFPPPRDIPPEKITAWISEDDADMRAFREGK